MTLYILVTGDPTERVRERRGDFTRLFQEALGDAWPKPLAPIDARHPLRPLPADAEGLLITGSSAHVPDRESWILAAEAWVREVVQAGVPTLGVCFGHQLLGQALGGACIRNPRGREIGTLPIERLPAGEDDPLLAGLPPVFEANVTHLDTVSVLPPGASALARSAQEEHQAIRFGERCWGLQFHPEVDRDVMCGYLEARREILTAEGRDVDTMIAGARETPLARGVLARFVEILSAG